MADKKQVATNVQEEEKQNDVANKEAASNDNDKTSGASKIEQKRTRLTNHDFFSNDVLGSDIKDRLVTTIILKSITARKIYNMTYEREATGNKTKASLDNYLYRHKQLISTPLAKDVIEALTKRIENRFKEMEDYVESRYKKVLNIYEQATSIEKFELHDGVQSEIETGFSTGLSKRFLSIIQKIDEICVMASYLEKTGHFDMKQEANLNSDLYRKIVSISRILMTFIARAVRSTRARYRELQATEKVAS